MEGVVEMVGFEIGVMRRLLEASEASSLVKEVVEGLLRKLSGARAGEAAASVKDSSTRSNFRFLVSMVYAMLGTSNLKLADMDGGCDHRFRLTPERQVSAALPRAVPQVNKSQDLQRSTMPRPKRGRTTSVCGILIFRTVLASWCLRLP